MTRYSELNWYLRRLVAGALGVLCLFAGSFGAAYGQGGSVRISVDQTTVIQGRPFFIYLEATGGQIELPQFPLVPGLTISGDPVQRSQQISVVNGRAASSQKWSFNAVAQRTGKFTIPSMQVTMDGAKVATEAITLTVVEDQPIATDGQAQLTKEDLVFTRLLADKKEVYQGEPLLLRKQLWRIVMQGITSGSYKGANIQEPSTEGFYAVELEPRQYAEDQGPWHYDVSEERQLLYPTGTGDLTIGSWHWEGVAQVPARGRNRSFFGSSVDEYPYAFDTQPIPVHVKPLPTPWPDHFKGAVGDFTISGALGRDRLMQGVLEKLMVTVQGQGNSDAIGEPAIPAIDWGYLSEPEIKTDSYAVPEEEAVRCVKAFTYSLTPLKPGNYELPPIRFAYFDPKAEHYVTKETTPFTIVVLAAPEGDRKTVVSPGIQASTGTIDVLAEDIRPLAARPARLRSGKGSNTGTALVWVLPPVAFAVAFGYTARKRRFASDRGYARAYKARAKAESLLREVLADASPADALYRAVAGFVGDKFNADSAGMTSPDVEKVLKERGTDAAIVSNVTKILRACERARYGSHVLSGDEMRALVSAAETVIGELK